MAEALDLRRAGSRDPGAEQVRRLWIAAGEAMFQYAEFKMASLAVGAMVAIGQKEALKQISGQVDHILLHSGYLSSMPPGDPNRNGWLGEIRAALKTIESRLNSLGRKTEAYRRAQVAQWKQQFIDYGGKW